MASFFLAEKLINTESSSNPFESILKNLKNVSKSNENSQENTQQLSNTSFEAEDSLDAELNEVREDKHEAQGDGGNDANSDAGGDNPETGGNTNGDPGSQDASGGSGADPMQLPGGDSGDNGQQSSLPAAGSVNRKLTLYTELNRIISVIQSSVDSLNEINSDSTEIKSCVAQLQKIYEDGKLVIGKIEDYSEADLFMNLELLKERSSLILEQLHRLQEQNHQKSIHKEN
jgi:hypothetical protein